MPSKKISLIHPLNPFNKRNIVAPLGLITNAGYIPDDYDVRLIDETAAKIDYNTDLAVISANTITARRAYEICKEFKKREIPAVLGGIHPSLIPEEAIKYAASVVIGNGENVWKELLNDFEDNQLKKIYNPELFDLTKARIPKRSLLKNRYFIDTLETSRGCPFNCEFCSVTQFNGSTYRYKPFEIIKKELESIKKRNIFLVDDNFLGAGKKAEERAFKLLKLLKEYDISWVGQASINIADKPELLKLARESGAMSFYIGFESINEDFLKSANKTINLRKGISSYKKVISKIHDHGINIMGSFIYGTDYDTKESLLRLKDFVSESGIDKALVKPLTPFPGTRLYNRFKEENRLLDSAYWLKEPYPVFTFKPKNLTIDELYEISLDFVEELKPSKSIKSFIRSLYSTHNFKGSLISFFYNMIDHYKQKNVLRKSLL